MMAPMKAAPASSRATASQVLPPASRPAAIRPTVPIAGATRSSAGGNSRPIRPGGAGTAVASVRSMPVIAATRAVLRSCSPCCPATPARRRATETASATTWPATIPAAATSRTGTEPKATPQASAPAANAR